MKEEYWYTEIFKPTHKDLLIKWNYDPVLDEIFVTAPFNVNIYEKWLSINDIQLALKEFYKHLRKYKEKINDE